MSTILNNTGELSYALDLVDASERRIDIEDGAPLTETGAQTQALCAIARALIGIGQKLNA